MACVSIPGVRHVRLARAGEVTPFATERGETGFSRCHSWHQRRLLVPWRHVQGLPIPVGVKTALGPQAIRISKNRTSAGRFSKRLHIQPTPVRPEVARVSVHSDRRSIMDARASRRALLCPGFSPGPSLGPGTQAGTHKESTPPRRRHCATSGSIRRSALPSCAAQHQAGYIGQSSCPFRMSTKHGYRTPLPAVSR